MTCSNAGSASQRLNMKSPVCSWIYSRFLLRACHCSGSSICSLNSTMAANIMLRFALTISPIMEFWNYGSGLAEWERKQTQDYVRQPVLGNSPLITQTHVINLVCVCWNISFSSDEHWRVSRNVTERKGRGEFFWMGRVMKEGFFW